jgi:biopolymer transport protein ExbD
MLRPPPRRTKADPNVAMINVVFLMLIFFMVAGSIAPPMARTITPVETLTAEPVPPPDAIILAADGTLTFRSREVSVHQFVADLTEDQRAKVRLFPDRDVPAKTLVATARALTEAGAQEVVLLSERALP